MIRNLLFVMCLLVAQLVVGQVYEGDLTITSQTDIDNFNYTEIIGSLIIDGTDLATVTGFETLKNVTGSITVTENEQLKTLNAFHNLTTVGRTVNIQNNEDLESISGFGKLEQIGTYINHNRHGTDYVRIGNNRSLKSIEGFESFKNIVGNFIIENNEKLETSFPFNSLETVGADFIIRNNDKLSSLVTGYDNLSSIGLSMFIQDNNSLLSVDGFPNLTTIGASLSIGYWERIGVGNEDLQTINGFQVLKSVGGAVQIELNEKLVSINGFNDLSNIGRWLKVHNNEDLEVINGFKSLEDVGTYINHNRHGTDYVRIGNNQSLKTIEGFNSLNHIVGSFVIENNDKLEGALPFNSLEEVDADFIIRNNNALEKINTGFNGLYSVKWAFLIQGNEKLNEISGFINLTNIGTSLVLGKWDNDAQINPNLTNISGFDLLENVGGAFQIQSNQNLKTISGFASLTDVLRYFHISNCNNLLTINGFGLLEDIGTYIGHNRHGTDYFFISKNEKLESINGFCSLQTITGDLRIEENPNLVNAENIFNNIEHVKNNFKLFGNSKFSNCCILNCKLIDEITDNTIQIENNAVGCSTVEEIKMCGESICEQFCTDDKDVCCECDGEGTSVWYIDIDDDSKGDPNISIISCEKPTGFVADNTDECDGVIDECGVCNGAGKQTWYQDADEDGRGNPQVSVIECTQPAGYVPFPNDFDESGSCDGIEGCTDNTACNFNPDAVCNNSNCIYVEADKCDCNGTPQTTYFADRDMDGLGDPKNSTVACQQPTSYVTNSNDDDDTVAACDEIPDGFCDCNSTIPETIYYLDMDDDGYGIPNNSITACNQPNGYSLVNTDMDDTNPNITDVVNINEIENSPIQIYPNPTTGMIQINFQNLLPQNFIVQLINPQGQLLFNKTIQNSTNANLIDIKHLPKGNYLLKITSELLNYK